MVETLLIRIYNESFYRGYQ